MIKAQIQGLIDTFESYSQVCEEAMLEIEKVGGPSPMLFRRLMRHLDTSFEQNLEPCLQTRLTVDYLKCAAQDIAVSGDVLSARRFNLIHIEAMRAFAEHEDDIDRDRAAKMWNAYNFALGMRRWASDLAGKGNGELHIEWADTPKESAAKDEPEKPALVTEFPHEELVAELSECRRMLGERIRKAVLEGIHGILSMCRNRRLEFTDVMQCGGADDLEMCTCVYDRHDECFYRATVVGLAEDKMGRVAVLAVDDQDCCREWKDNHDLTPEELADILENIIEMNRMVAQGVLVLKDEDRCTRIAPAE